MVVRKGLGKNMDSVFSMKNVADVIDNPKVPEPKSSFGFVKKFTPCVISSNSPN